MSVNGFIVHHSNSRYFVCCKTRYIWRTASVSMLCHICSMVHLRLTREATSVILSINRILEDYDEIDERQIPLSIET